MRVWLATLTLLAGCGSVSEKPVDAMVDSDPGPGDATLVLASANGAVQQNNSAMVGFTLVRDAQLTGPLTVRVEGTPAEVTSVDVEVPPGSSSGMLRFDASATATQGAMSNVKVTLFDGTRMLDEKSLVLLVTGAPGTLDTTFGTNGRSVFPLPDPIVAAASGNALVRSVAQYPATAGVNAGKIVLAVELRTTGTQNSTQKAAIVRLNADGTPDNGFGTSGYAIIDASPANAFAPRAVTIDSQGRIVVSAYRIGTDTVCTAHVTRWTTGGTADAGFAAFNNVPPGMFCGAGVRSAALLGGDKIEVMNQWNNPDESERPLLMRINSDGTLDNTAYAGSYAIRVANPTTTKKTIIPSEILVDSQGRYVVAGAKCDGGWNANYAACESMVGRLTTAGAWDSAFGDAGTGNLGYSSLTFGTTAATPEIQRFGAIAFDGNGDIVAAGWAENYATGTIARFDGVTGALDTTFGASGRIAPTLVTGATAHELTDVLVDAQGRIVLAGYAFSGGPLIVTTRYSANGTLDATYGTSGVQTAASSALEPRAVLQADGRLLVFGAYPRGAGMDLAIWRFWP